jgi:Protein of unknown function (DUF1326)
MIDGSVGRRWTASTNVPAVEKKTESDSFGERSTTMTDIPHWWMRGDWFDVCSCDITCPCEFAQPPTNNRCEGVLAYKVRKGAYGDVRLDGLNVLGIGQFTRQKENGARVSQKRSRRLSLPKVAEVLLFVQAPACIPT